MHKYIEYTAYLHTGKKIYSIGKITTSTLESLGYKVSLTGNSDFEAMLEKIDKENCSSGEWI